jgi:YVTN family beta-propeller protein
MKWRSRHVLAVVTGVVVLGSGVAFAGVGRQAGPRSDGTAITPVGFRVTPVGQQTPLGLLPLGSALSPDRSRLLVTNDGQGVQSLQVVDTASGKVTQTIEYRTPEALYAGVVWSPDGTRAYASAGGNNKIRVFTVSGGTLTETTALKLPTTNPDGVRVNMFPAGLAISSNGKKLYVADQVADAFSVIDVASGEVKTTAVGHNPYGVALAHDGKTAYVTDQGANTVSVVDVAGDAPKADGTVTVGTVPAVRDLRQLLRRRRGERAGLELGGREQLQPVRGADLAGELLQPQRPLTFGERRRGHRSGPLRRRLLHLAAAGQGRQDLP